uniref:EF-hand domain-containing protein n=1 Tax=Cannabis sativa TaxID=3483 RepID=A0A803P0W0_CANSA
MGFNFKVLTHPYDDKQLKGIFERYDANGDGRLSKEELKNAFKSFGCFAPGWRAFRARHFADKNGDGTKKKDLDAILQAMDLKWEQRAQSKMAELKLILDEHLA